MVCRVMQWFDGFCTGSARVLKYLAALLQRA